MNEDDQSNTKSITSINILNLDSNRKKKPPQPKIIMFQNSSFLKSSASEQNLPRGVQKLERGVAKIKMISRFRDPTRNSLGIIDLRKKVVLEDSPEKEHSSPQSTLSKRIEDKLKARKIIGSYVIEKNAEALIKKTTNTKKFKHFQQRMYVCI